MKSAGLDKAAYNRDYMTNKAVQKLLTLNNASGTYTICHLEILENLDEPFTKSVKRLIREDTAKP